MTAMSSSARCARSMAGKAFRFTKPAPSLEDVFIQLQENTG